MLPDLRELSALVMTVAVEELIPRFAEVQRYHKADGSVVTAADLALQARLQEELASRWPQFPKWPAILGGNLVNSRTKVRLLIAVDTINDVTIDRFQHFNANDAV